MLEAGPAAQYDPHHHQRTQHTLQLFPITHPTFVPSQRAATICGIHRPHRSTPLPARPWYSPQHHLPHRPRCASDHRADPFRRPTGRHLRLLYAARRQRQHPPVAVHALYALTASSMFTATRPRRVRGRARMTCSLSSRSSYAVCRYCADTKILLCSPLPPNTRLLRLPFGNADRKRTRARGGTGYLLWDFWWSTGSDASYASFLPFFSFIAAFRTLVILLH
ncbi:hypothetical protein K438DRAFT_1840246 [Mycena galopus ATCC 62051]|nr:hypothetical protein K438DRAFT_1840246 [Mycena galopus ATCC 62051]